MDARPSPVRSGGAWRRADTTAVIVAAVVVAVTTALALVGTSAFEADVFGAFNGLPEWLYGPVWLVMQLGTIGIAAIVGLVVGFALRRPALARLFVATPVVAWFAAKAIKDVVERGRPAAEGLAATIRGTADGGYGFVSGHSAVSFALATVVAPHLPGRWRLVPFALATVVALGRLYVGAHLPLDVIGGAALGIVVGEAMRGVEVLVDRRASST
jgi:undecaprenyl-diphosphatase